MLKQRRYAELLSGLNPYKGAIEFDSMCEGTDFQNHEENLINFVKIIPNIRKELWKFTFSDIYESITLVWQQKYVHAKYLRVRKEPNAFRNRLRLLPTHFEIYIIEVNKLTTEYLNLIVEMFPTATRIVIKYYSYADTEVVSRITQIIRSGQVDKYKFVYKQMNGEK